jgi:phosphatidate cytidylyltransferase
MPSKSSTGGNAGTAPPSPSAEILPITPPKPSDLKTRVLSAVVLAPPVLAAVWFGGPVFLFLIVLVAAISAWEWVRLIVPQPRRALLVMATLFVATICFAAMGGSLVSTLGMTAVCTFFMLLATRYGAASRSPYYRAPHLWLTFGVLYLGLAGAALVYLRVETGDAGRGLFLFLLLAIWATDIGAYAAGRLIGGPKLMPRVSPKKTWAGLAGGVLASALVGWLVASHLLHAAAPGLVALVAAVLAVVGQAGDLFESFVKRRSQVKDSGALIPGHGGLLDRIDGLIAAALVLAGFHGLSHEALPWW